MRSLAFLTFSTLLFFVPISFGQSDERTLQPAVPTPTPTAIAVGKTDAFQGGISQKTRAESYRKLLEGQRFIWTLRNSRNELARSTAKSLAQNALRKAVELNPRLAEGYTALAELQLSGRNPDIDEAIALSTVAIRIDNNNFGAHKFLGRLYTVKSGLGNSGINKAIANKAVASWKEVGRLDDRNAEAWAFLSIFYKELNKSDQRIGALQKWLAAANTPDSGFYLTVNRGSKGLAPENAAVDLGEALLDSGRHSEALPVLARAVSESPNNLQAIDLLGRALENADEKELAPATEGLRQAVYANPKNISLIQMLANTLHHVGDIDGAAQVLKRGATRLPGRTGSGLLMALGDIYSDAGQVDESLLAYNQALKARGVKTNRKVGDSDRGFTLLIIGKMVAALQKDDRVVDAEKVIDDSRSLFSVDDFVLDRERISLMRVTGRRVEALSLLKSLRQKAPDDYNLIRKEAELLTDLGRVDEAAQLIVPLIEDKPKTVTRSIKYDDFVNRLFIAGLYIQAGRESDAILQAEKALTVAKGNQSKQLANLRIASAQFVGGDYASAEKSLKAILAVTPNNPMALNDLGYLYLRKGDNFKEALGFIERAVRIDPRNPDYLDSLGLAYFKLGDLDKAEKFLRKALRFDINSPDANEHLGDVLLKKGKKDLALPLWKKAMTIFTNNDDLERIQTKIGD
jgi:tetratricopeptide (TPR) repeat protein